MMNRIAFIWQRLISFVNLHSRNRQASPSNPLLMLLRIFILLTCVTFAATVNEAAEPSLGQTLKKIFSTPTPTPHRKKKTATAAKKKSPTPTPSKTSPPSEKE